FHTGATTIWPGRTHDRRMELPSFGLRLAAGVCIGALALPASGLTAAQPSFKNVKVLTGLTPEELRATMSFMALSLGVTCEHCHVNPWDSDVKKPKQTARAMLEMVRSLNAASFGGRPVVSCETCHRGSIRPRSTPDLANAAWRAARTLPGAPAGG